MKKTLVLVTVFILLMISVASAADPSESFTFRNGVKWGMNRQKVTELEGDSYGGHGSPEGLSVAIYYDVRVSKYEGELDYIFYNDSLCICDYELGEVDNGAFDYLVQVFESKYGTGMEAEAKDFCYAYSTRIRDSVPSIATVSLRNWQLADGTQIWLCTTYDGGALKCSIVYLCPDQSAPVGLDYTGI